jgi:hypothetical protein
LSKGTFTSAGATVHLALHFPLADVRRYAPDAQVPAWPLNPPRDFVRGFGRARTRSERRWADRFPAESTYCDAKRVLRFGPHLQRSTLGSNGSVIQPYCAHRRLVGDALGALRLEVGMGTYTQTAPKHLDGDSVLSLLARTLELRVSVHTPDGPKNVELSRADLSIARAYLSATTSRKAEAPPRWWVTPGRELCVVMYDPDTEVAALPGGTKSIGAVVVPIAAGTTAIQTPASDGVTAAGTTVSALPSTTADAVRLEIAHLAIEHRGVSVRVLFVAVPRAARHGAAVHLQLRTHLARVHTERECLKEVLRLIDIERLPIDAASPSGERLQDYLRAAFRRLNRPTFEGLPQESLARAMEDGYDAITEEQRDRIMSRLAKARPSVMREATAGLATSAGVATNIFAETIMVSSGGIVGGSGNQVVNLAAGASIHGPVVNGVIRDSFNVIEKSNASTELKAELTNLTTLVAQMVEKLDKERATEATRDLKALTEEATSPTPRRRWYELSSAGLLEAAKFVGEFAGKLTASVGAVTKLLGF